MSLQIRNGITPALAAQIEAVGNLEKILRARADQRSGMEAVRHLTTDFLTTDLH